MSKPLPCPLCGSGDVHSASGYDCLEWVVCCQVCGVGLNVWALTAEESKDPEDVRSLDEARTLAEARWNTRSPEVQA